jgi:pimeloyl-ACP methyl ester carboxylesterase
LPGDPTASREEGASIYLINVDAASPTYGTRIPLQFGFKEEAGESIGENWLGCLPFPGFVMAEETTYALVVTNRLRSADGGSVLSTADFRAVMDRAIAEEPRLARAQQIYQPLADYLDEAGGDEREDVVNAAVFTTQNATSLLGKFREVIRRDLPAPIARDVEIRSEPEDSVIYLGVYDSPNFQAGDFPYRTLENGGGFEIDPVSGDPIIQGSFELRFSMSLPTSPMPAEGWPVVFYGHGTGGDYRSYESDGTGLRLAKEGIAVVSIDQPMHGTRLVGGDPQTTFFNILNPLAGRGNVIQAALEGFEVVRLIENFEFTDVDPYAREIRFDSDKIGYFGHSQGSTTGLPFVAHEPQIKGAVFSGAGGLLYLTLLFKTLPFDIPSIVGLIVRDLPLDRFNPALALMQVFFEPADVITYARLLVQEPPEGNVAKNVFQTQGLTDRYTPIPSIEALATAIGVDLAAPQEREVAGLQLLGTELLPLPVTDNAGGVTSVLAQYNEAIGSDGHFVVFDIAAARVQTSKFLKTLFDTGTATLVAP